MTHTEIEITAELVRDLLRDQHPDLADRPVRLGARGWDNKLWRLGDDLAVRVPWATQSADALLSANRSLRSTSGPPLPRPAGAPSGAGR
ncbi:phosphotransferase [Streptomyces sp. NPDC003758]